MYFTRLEANGSKLIVMSQYVSTRLVRKGPITSYYVAKCLTNRVDPTLVNTTCFIKQTIVQQQPKNKKGIVQDRQQSNVQKYRKLYLNEIQIHEYVEANVNYSPKYFSKLHDYWHNNEGLYHTFTIVTKYEEYGDLNHFIEYIKENKIQLSETEVIYILHNVLKSSLELYKIGVVHRDIKPENIFIDEFFQFKLGDFGVAMVDKQPNYAPYSTEVIGTYGYMAPDYFLQKPYSFPVDVWAVGVILYRLIYLQYPINPAKQGYGDRVKKQIKDIKHFTTYSDKFSDRLKKIMKQNLLQHDPQKRQKSINIYEFQYLNQFRSIQVAMMLRKKYETYIKDFNKCNMAQFQKYSLQQHSLYHDRVIDMVRYQQWGYFFLLSNLKVIGLFNSQANNKIIKIYPDCLDQVRNPKEDLHCNVITHVNKIHFHQFQSYLLNQGKVYARNFNSTISNIVQYKDTLAIRLTTDPQLSQNQLKARQTDIIKKVTPQYQSFEPNSSNNNPIDYCNNTVQIFFFPSKNQKIKKMPFTTYEYSIILNNNMVKKQEVLISKIINNREDTYELTRYPSPENILFTQNTVHKNIHRHAQKLFAFSATRRREETPRSVDFLNDYSINQI